MHQVLDQSYEKIIYSEIFKFWKFSVRNCGLVMNSQVMRNEGVLVECLNTSHDRYIHSLNLEQNMNVQGNGFLA